MRRVAKNRTIEILHYIINTKFLSYEQKVFYFGSQLIGFIYIRSL